MSSDALRRMRAFAYVTVAVGAVLLAASACAPRPAAVEQEEAPRADVGVRGGSVDEVDAPTPAVPSQPTPADPAPAELGIAPEMKCGRYLYQGLYEVSGNAPPPIDAAHRAYDGALEATAVGKDGDAARLFLACARHYRPIADKDPTRATADSNAQVCYYDAIFAFANAGELAASGRAALTAAAREDPRFRKYVTDLLADAPSECTRR